ncbi:MAG: DUF971 domain-containing protein [Acetobacteraceae bacterium]
MAPVVEVRATEIRLDRATGALDVTFDDGTRFRLPAEYLRVESPSAEVQGHGPGERKVIGGRRHVRVIGIEPVGNYAVRLTFDDLHDTGIFSWDYLHQLGQEQATRWQAYLDALASRSLSRDPAIPRHY